jgi:hypothetical protein
MARRIQAIPFDVIETLFPLGLLGAWVSRLEKKSQPAMGPPDVSGPDLVSVVDAPEGRTSPGKRGGRHLSLAPSRAWLTVDARLARR